MSIYIGNSQIGKIYIGNQRIGRVYVGSQLVYSDYTKCIENGRLIDGSAFGNLVNVGTLDVQYYTDDYVIFGAWAGGDYSGDPTLHQDLVADGRIYFDPVYVGEKCKMYFRSFYSARGGDSITAYIKNGNNTISTIMESPYNKQTHMETFIISDTELRLHAEYHGTSTQWAPTIWIGIGQMEIGDP